MTKKMFEPAMAKDELFNRYDDIDIAVGVRGAGGATALPFVKFEDVTLKIRTL